MEEHCILYKSPWVLTGHYLQPCFYPPKDIHKIIKLNNIFLLQSGVKSKQFPIIHTSKDNFNEEEVLLPAKNNDILVTPIEVQFKDQCLKSDKTNQRYVNFYILILKIKYSSYIVYW